MSRKKRKTEIRDIKPDWKYNNVLIEEFKNKILLKGKKEIASKILYNAMDIAAKKIDMAPGEVIKKAISNVKPILEVKSRRVGGATYQVPVEVSKRRAVDLAIRWIIRYAKMKKGKPMAQRLAEEFVDAIKNQGGAIKKKEDTHKMAEANRAFAHFKW